MSMLPRSTVVTIAAGASLSSGAFIGESVLCGIIYPAVWTAAKMSFQVSLDGTTYHDLYADDGTEVQFNPTLPDGKLIGLPSDAFAAALWIKVRSGLTGAAVNQAAERSITLISRKFFPRS